MWRYSETNIVVNKITKEVQHAVLIYCKRGDFHVGVILVFSAFVYSAKITPREKPLYAFMKEWVVSWKIPQREMACQYFREIFPSQK